MQLQQALRIIRGEDPVGYFVAYEHTDGRIRTFSAFPSVSCRPPEPPIRDLGEAWQLAERFAASAPNCYENITVTGSDHRRVDPSRIYRRNDLWKKNPSDSEQGHDAA